ncbi:MAG: hemerythrin domain-containing protein [Chloroflexi bacterium]|nr:hemerythrin domain-containing protein [Chloroflexota bacterium]
MSFNKSCPGSRAVKEPTPEYHPCPNCGEEVEIWTHELSYPCSKCGTRVFRIQRPSCIDWCPHAKDCIGSELYDGLKPKKSETPAGSTPLDTLVKEHEEALTKLAQLRATTVCLKVKATAPADKAAPSFQVDLDHLNDIIAFFDGDLRRHFSREENALFPIVDRHIDGSGPSKVLLAEHKDLWEKHDLLKAGAQAIKADGNPGVVAGRIYDIASQIITLLRGHIEKENTSLVPLARSLLTEEELQELRGAWK